MRLTAGLSEHKQLLIGLCALCGDLAKSKEVGKHLKLHCYRHGYSPGPLIQVLTSSFECRSSFVWADYSLQVISGRVCTLLIATLHTLGFL